MILSVILHSYNNQSCLDMQIDAFLAGSDDLREKFELIVVDDASEPPLFIDKEIVARPNLLFLRVKKDIAWNMAGCKNLGVLYSKSDWILFTDICHIVQPKGIHSIVTLIDTLDENTLYFFHRTFDDVLGLKSKVHPNTFLVNRRRLLDHKGVDECFVGHYGYEDIYFIQKWIAKGGKKGLIDVTFHDHGRRTEGLSRDLTRNHALIESLVSNGCPMSDYGIINFQYERVFRD